MKRLREGGFTIIELLLATSIFSIVLLAALASFLQISHIYYKGISITQTQNTATQVLNDVVANIKAAPEQSGISNLNSSNGYFFYCINGYRYTATVDSSGRAVMTDFSQTKNYNSGTNHGNFGLLKDSLPGGNSSCAPPCVAGSCAPTAVAFNNPTEMLGDHMRLANFCIDNNITTVAYTATCATSENTLYNINIIIAYGTDSVLSWKDNTHPFCRGSSSSQQFCAVASVNSSLYWGLKL